MQRVLVFFTILVIIIAIPRGFDFSDEGLYVLLADPNQQNLGGIFNYDLFFKLIFKFSGIDFGIKGLRVFRLISYFLGAFGLAFFWKNLQKASRISFPIFLLALTGLFAGYGFLPASLSYNSISVVAVCLWLGIVSNEALNWKYWLLLGLVFLTLFYSKITVCFLLGFLTILYFGFNKQLNFKYVLFLLTPFIFFEGLFFILFQENALSRLFAEQGFLHQRQDYSMVLLIRFTMVGIFWILFAAFFFLIAGKLKHDLSKLYSTVLVLATFVLCAVFYWTRITEEWSHIFPLTTFALIGMQMGQVNWKQFKSKKRFFIFVLIALPFLLHFGSNVYWMRLGIHYWVFWLFAFALLIQTNSVKFQIAFHRFSAVSSLLLVIVGIWITPFEGSYLWDSSYSWEYRPGKKILLSKPQIDFLKKLKFEIEPFESGEIASLYLNPGLLYLLNRTSPHIPGYWKPSQAKIFLGNGDELELILFNQRETFPFDQKRWKTKDELIQPDGEKLQVLWRN
ncbi:MAG: hypothetical protein ACI9UV_000002 [Algoriphagus sp.]|jgi:hypothetical protein